MKREINHLLALSFLLICFVSCQSTPEKPEIEIESGKVGMIGYGSLISFNETEATLGRKYEDSVYLVHLEGYQREWSYVGSNKDSLQPKEFFDYDGFYIKNTDTLSFEKIIFLNIAAKEGGSVNAVLYFISENELAQFDERELGYERIDVSNNLREYSIKNGKVYAYKALPDNTYVAERDQNVSKIDKSYVDLVINACDSIGADFRKEYDASTLPFHPDLMAEVFFIKMR
ncbi:MAG TPA: hypothetical protein DIS90_04375 [Cytophagales bacterium]|nr:hypothetical protein [Cytophagales bacterium]